MDGGRLALGNIQVSTMMKTVLIEVQTRIGPS